MKWTYYFARKFSASRFEIVMRVYFSDFYLQKFGARLQNILVKPAGDNHAIYYIDKEWEIFSNNIYNGVCKDLKTFNRYVALIKKTQAQSLKTAQTIAAQSLKKLSFKQLGKLWEQWDKAHLEHFIKPIQIPFVIEPLLAKDTESICQKHKITLEVVFSPEEPNAIVNERISLLRLTLGHSDKILADHAAEFGFIPCYDVIDKPWDEAYFQKELEKLRQKPALELKHHLKELTGQFAKRKSEFEEMLATTKLTKRETELLIMAHQMVFIKDERDDYRRRQCFAIQPLFKELARRYNLPFRAPLYLIHDEMTQWFETGKLPVGKTELENRIKGYCLARLDGQPTAIYSGKTMVGFLATQQFNDTQNSTTQSVKGMIGNKGLAQGRAVIVITKHDLRKVRHGDILVSVTTNPDYVSAMRKCRGFVTDEGGITSHAAIVSRELNIPCLVGTKTATKTFHDGEMIQVETDKGIARRMV